MKFVRKIMCMSRDWFAVGEDYFYARRYEKTYGVE